MSTIRLVGTWVVGCMLLVSVSTTAFAQDEFSLVGAAERWDAIVAQAAALRADLGDVSYVLEDAALALAFETPEAIAAWVAERVGYEPYAGLLRGPQGTLDAGRGNALDQAVLLARLLGDVGFDTEVALASLSDDDVRRLLAGAMAPATPPALAPEVVRRRDGLAAEIDALIAATVPDAARPEPAASVDPAALRSAAERDGADLLAALAAAGIALGGGPLDAAVLADASAYAWVRVRGPGGAWLDLHPAFGDAPPVLSPERTLVGSVPDDLQHRVRLEVIMERRRGDVLESVRVAGPFERPVALLTDEPLSLVLHPLRAVDVENLYDGPLDGFVVPVLAGSVDGALAFDPLTGAAMSVEDAADPAAGVIREVARGFGAAAGAVGSRTAVAEVTAVWLDVVLVAPGGRETHWRRALIDRIGAEHRASGQVDLGDASWAPLRTQVSITVATGPVAPATVLARRLDEWIAAAPFVRFVLEQADQPDPDATFPGTGTFAVPDARSLLTLTDVEMPSTYRSGPTVVVRQQGLVGPDDAPGERTWIDVLAAPSRSLAGARPGGALADPAAALAHGVALSRFEAWPLAALGDPEAVTAPGQLRRALDAGASLLVIRPGDGDALAGLELPAGAHAAVAADLAAGQVVVVAVGADVGGLAAWWRVDPVTGDTLGMLADGRGGSVAGGYIQLMILIGGTATLIGMGILELRARKCRVMADIVSNQLMRPDARQAFIGKCIWGKTLYSLRTSLTF